MRIVLITVMLFVCFQKDMSTYQLNRYQKDRYLKTIIIRWMELYKLVGLFVLFVGISSIQEAHAFEILLSIIFTYVYLKQYEEKPLALKYTPRMLRMSLVIIVTLVLSLSILSISDWLLALLISVSMSMHSLVFCVFIWMVHPLEMKIRTHYKEMAQAKLSKMNCLKIGITGSYGKTSIKNILSQILSEQYLTLPTPLSYNNEMGIAKTILNDLQVSHEIFVCEMGADHLHEIEDLCNFVHPKMGILSSVGPQHLSTFKNIQNVLYEKMKLIESLPIDGIGFINHDNEYIRNCDIQAKCKLVRVGIHSVCDVQAVHIECDQQGSRFDCVIDGVLYPFKMKLLGEHNVLNTLFAIALAKECKLDMRLIQVAVENLKPIKHRLELCSFHGATLIDNAYNSNPDSALKSLEVLKNMPNHRFLITPGFIDLGEFHEYYSHRFGMAMKGCCDTVILVGDNQAILNGLNESEFPSDHILTCPTMKLALQVVQTLIKDNDTILIENDIPEGLTQS